MSKNTQTDAAIYFSAAVMFFVDKAQEVDTSIVVKYPKSSFAGFIDFVSADGEIVTKNGKQKVFTLDAEISKFIESLVSALISDLKDYDRDDESKNRNTLKEFTSYKPPCFIKAISEFDSSKYITDNSSLDNLFESFTTEVTKLRAKLQEGIERMLFITGKTVKVPKTIAREAIDALCKLLFLMGRDPALNLIFVNTKSISKIPLTSVKAAYFRILEDAGLKLPLVITSLMPTNGNISEKEITQKSRPGAKTENKSATEKKASSRTTNRKAIINDSSESEESEEEEEEKEKITKKKKKSSKSAEKSDDEESD